MKPLYHFLLICSSLLHNTQSKISVPDNIQSDKLNKSQNQQYLFNFTTMIPVNIKSRDVYYRNPETNVVQPINEPETQLLQPANQMPPKSSNTANNNPIVLNNIKLLLYNVKELTQQLLNTIKEFSQAIYNTPANETTVPQQPYENRQSNPDIVSYTKPSPFEPEQKPAQYINNARNNANRPLETRPNQIKNADPAIVNKFYPRGISQPYGQISAYGKMQPNLNYVPQLPHKPDLALHEQYERNMPHNYEKALANNEEASHMNMIPELFPDEVQFLQPIQNYNRYRNYPQFYDVTPQSSEERLRPQQYSNSSRRDDDVFPINAQNIHDEPDPYLQEGQIPQLYETHSIHSSYNAPNPKNIYNNSMLSGFHYEPEILDKGPDKAIEQASDSDKLLSNQFHNYLSKVPSKQNPKVQGSNMKRPKINEPSAEQLIEATTLIKIPQIQAQIYNEKSMIRNSNTSHNNSFTSSTETVIIHTESNIDRKEKTYNSWKPLEESDYSLDQSDELIFEKNHNDTMHDEFESSEYLYNITKNKHSNYDGHKIQNQKRPNELRYRNKPQTERNIPTDPQNTLSYDNAPDSVRIPMPPISTSRSNLQTGSNPDNNSPYTQQKQRDSNYANPPNQRHNPYSKYHNTYPTIADTYNYNNSVTTGHYRNPMIQEPPYGANYKNQIIPPVYQRNNSLGQEYPQQRQFFYESKIPKPIIGKLQTSNKNLRLHDTNGWPSSGRYESMAVHSPNAPKSYHSTQSRGYYEGAAVPAPFRNHVDRHNDMHSRQDSPSWHMAHKPTSEEIYSRRENERAYFKKKMMYMVHRYGNSLHQNSNKIDSWCQQCEHDRPNEWCGCSRSCADSMKGWNFDDFKKFFPRQRSISGLYRCRFRKFIHDNVWYFRELWKNQINPHHRKSENLSIQSYTTPPHGWKAAANGKLPVGAFQGGYSHDKYNLYVIRAKELSSNNLIPGMLKDTDTCGRIAHDNENEGCIANYEVLLGDTYTWLRVDAHRYRFHIDRVYGGSHKNIDYYICRLSYQTGYIITKLDVVRGCYVASPYKQYFGGVNFQKTFDMLIN